MQSYKSLFTYGFAIFAMFFGSGNLVFPLTIGLSSGSYWLVGFLGLFLTGIILPFLGLFVIKLHRGSYISFFKEAGPLAAIVVPLALLSLLGSFGVIPRCIAVAYGGINSMFSGISIALFSGVFCVLTYIMCLKDQMMMRLLGKWMSPILLGLLSILILVGVLKAPEPQVVTSQFRALNNGFLTGYQTMDLLAAFFFSALVFKQIQASLSNSHSQKKLIMAALKPSAVGAVMLAVVYFGFVYLGAHYQQAVPLNATPELILPSIASYILGTSAALIIGLAIIFSCLTTAVALNNIYARYLVELLKLKDGSFPIVLLATTSISFSMSLLDFKGISEFLTPLLEMSYPSIIMLTVFSIATPTYKLLKKILFYSLILIMALLKYAV